MEQEIKNKRKFKLKFSVMILIILYLGIFASVIFLTYYHDDLVINNVIEKEYQYELEMIRTDFKTYGYLSKDVINEYLRGIEDNYKYDEVPIGLSYAIIITESDGRFWKEHSEVIPKDLGYKVRAKGSAGIIFDFWKKLIRDDSKIIEVESDLFIPYKSVRSMGAILKNLIIQIKLEKKNKNISEYDLINEVVRRYYGEYNKEYYDKMVQFTSYLWMKRINKYLLDLDVEKLKQTDSSYIASKRFYEVVKKQNEEQYKKNK